MKSVRTRIDGHEVEVSNLDKVMYPEVGFTKGQVIEYYTRAAPFIIPHLEGRPITLKRYPDGVRGQHFYEKNAPSFTPKWIKTFPVWRSSGRSQIHYVLIEDTASLVWSANTANLELHPFLARVPAIDSPTMLVFDLDPGDGASIVQSCEVALLLKAVLQRLGLKAYAKASGSKGIHVHVPLNTPVTYAATQPFARAIAQMLESEHPSLIVSEMAKTKRHGKVFIDWSQNVEYKSTVSVYSLRAKRERPFVAMPVGWPEIKKAAAGGDADPLFFTPEDALARLKKYGDTFAPILTVEQRLPDAFLEVGGGSIAPAAPGTLETYRRKRDFTKTPEPAPAPPRSASADARLFVVQKHAASHLHYDFRLQTEGVLRSWAVPKGPPWTAGEKRLAMQTEDHPLDYASFEGTIPKGEYGGGTVMVWDTGSYEVLDGNYYKGKLHLLLKGHKLQGEWVLVRKDDAHGSDKKSWLLIKAGGDAARPESRLLDRSVLSSRSMEEIARADGPVWHSNRGPAEPRIQPAARRPVPRLDPMPKARPRFMRPMLARPVAELPQDRRRWTYEIKFDGYRCLAVKTQGKVTLYSRNRNILNGRFANIVAALEGLATPAVIDGEIVALDRDGRPSFNRLQNVEPEERSVLYYVFDLLVYGDKGLLTMPLSERRDVLRTIITGLPDTIRFSENFDTTPAQLVKSAGELGLEGIVAKLADSAYSPGERSGAWVKYHIKKRQEFVVGGYIPGTHGFDALLVGVYERERLMFVAKVRNGFVSESRRKLFEKLTKLETDDCPFANLPEPRNARRGEALTAAVMKKCKWLVPRLVAEIEFTEWTEANHLRHSRFAGLRDDKHTREVVRETD